MPSDSKKISAKGMHDVSIGSLLSSGYHIVFLKRCYIGLNVQYERMNESVNQIIRLLRKGLPV